MTSEIENLKQDITKKKYVLIDFWADWCKPCKTMSPILEKIEKERNDIEIIKINVDNNAAITIEYNIKSIPTLIFFKEGHAIDSLVGSFSENKILDFINICVIKSQT